MVESLSDGQYDTLIGKIETAAIRDRCIILFLLHAGLRNGEVCALNLGDFYVGNSIVHTINVQNGHCGGGSSRYITLSPPLITALVQYMKTGTLTWGGFNLTAPAFITKNRKIRISPRDVQRIVEHYTKTWLGTPVTPHSLRHTFATRLMRVSNIRVVQQLLGHRSLTSTQVYTHPTSDDRANAIATAF